LYTIDRQRFGQWPRNTLCIKSNFADSDYWVIDDVIIL
jgi:hypothetical protein